ncbi:MAG: hypothetical protein AAF242_19375 [Bacteroidota bacterium]
MELSITQVPAWISISFGILMLSVPTYLIANTVKDAANRSGEWDGNQLQRRTLRFYFAYFLGISFVSFTGFFTVNTLPPRIIIFAVIPLFLFYLLWVQNRAWFSSVLAHVHLEQLIAIHIFRFVGVYFFLAYMHGALPRSFAMIGGTGDVLTALFAIPVIYFLRKKAPFAKMLAWAWNIFGLLDILSVISTAVVVTRAAIATGEVGVGQFGTFPFSWIPAFAPATIVFLHILVFRKLVTADEDIEVV